MKTSYLIEVEHKKPLPGNAETVIGNRVYMWLYSQGIEVGVEVEKVEPETQGEAKAAA